MGLRTLSCYANMLIMLLFGVLEMFFSSAMFEQYGIKLPAAPVPGSMEDLIQVFFITVGMADVAFACLFIYALAYHDNHFITALLRIVSLVWSGLVYVQYTRGLPYYRVLKLNAAPLQAQMALSVAMAVLSLVGSFGGGAAAGAKKKTG